MDFFFLILKAPAHLFKIPSNKFSSWRKWLKARLSSIRQHMPFGQSDFRCPEAPFLLNYDGVFTPPPVPSSCHFPLIKQSYERLEALSSSALDSLLCAWTFLHSSGQICPFIQNPRDTHQSVRSKSHARVPQARQPLSTQQPWPPRVP